MNARQTTHTREHAIPLQQEFGLSQARANNTFEHGPLSSSPRVPMTSSVAHPPFTRNYGGIPDRSKGTAFGSAQQRDAQRTDRDRERIERERLEREGQEQMNQLSEEQREEINQAVR